LNKNVQKLLERRYFRGEEESWEELVERVANHVAGGDYEKEDQYRELIENRFFIPSSPCLMNAGNVNQLSSCFIVDVEDDTMEDIMRVATECSKIFQKNGGVGFSLATLRPNNTELMSSDGKSCGVTGFMEIFDKVADVVTRNNNRKSAIKIDLPVWHPDILEYISIKDDTEKLTRMNISVMVTDEFMEAVENNDMWELVFPNYSWQKALYDEYWSGDLETWKAVGGELVTYKELPARELYNRIMEHAHKTGEPGISFKDNMNKDNNLFHKGKIKSTNPCSEFTSIPYNSCNLGSINLLNVFLKSVVEAYRIIHDGHSNCSLNYDEFSREKAFELAEYFMDEDGNFEMQGQLGHQFYENLGLTVKEAVQFLDDMISQNELPLDRIQEVTEGSRPVGLGIMGFADFLAMIGVRYGSEKSLEYTHDIFREMERRAKEKSEELGAEHGVYPYFEEGIGLPERRNSHLLSIAPTGSISIIGEASSGIEPNFGWVQTRRTAEDDLYTTINPVLEFYLDYHGIDKEEAIGQISANMGTVPADIRNEYNMGHFVVGTEVYPEEHLDVLEKATEFVDLSISKTINFPNEASVEDIKDIYMDAWERGIKCVTVYRQGSRDDVVTGGTGGIEEEGELKRGDIVEAQEEAFSKRFKLQTGCGTLYLNVVFDNAGNIIEVFNTTSNGGCSIFTEATSRLISLALRGGIELEEVLDQLYSPNACASYQYRKGKKGDVSMGSNCVSAIANKLKKYVDKKEDLHTLEEIEEEVKEEESKAKCPECDNYLENKDGCISCSTCGFSKCG